MIIAICGSMTFAEEMLNAKEYLQKRGHKVFVPAGVEGYQERKVDLDFLSYYFSVIRLSHAILVLNYKKYDIEGYIGGNAFLEMGFAHILKVKIFLLNPVPNMKWMEQEVLAMNPAVINGNLNLLGISPRV